MSCDQIQEELELYALGALENDEANAVKAHLAAGCSSCAEALQRAMDLNILVARNVPLVDPPPGLGLRIRASVAPTAPRRNTRLLGWVLAAAALAVLAIGLAVQMRLRQREASTEQREAAEQVRLSSALRILEAPGTRQVPIRDPQRPQLRGSVYVHQKLGLALIIDSLPEAPAGWKYESWVVPKQGDPRPVEPFHPDRDGRAVSVVPGPVPVADIEDVAVSMEPEDSRPTKVTTLLFKAKI